MNGRRLAVSGYASCLGVSLVSRLSRSRVYLSGARARVEFSLSRLSVSAVFAFSRFTVHCLGQYPHSQWLWQCIALCIAVILSYQDMCLCEGYMSYLIRTAVYLGIILSAHWCLSMSYLISTDVCLSHCCDNKSFVNKARKCSTA